MTRPALASRRRALALVGLALLSACAEPPAAERAEARSRISLLIAEDVDPALGPAKVLVDGALVGELDRGCGVVVDAPIGERSVEVVWATRATRQTVRVIPGETAFYEVGGALAIEPAAPPEGARGPVCSF